MALEDYGNPGKSRLPSGIQGVHVVLGLAVFAIVAVLIWLTHTPVTMHGLLLAGEIVVAGLAVAGTLKYMASTRDDVAKDPVNNSRVPATVIFNVTLFIMGGLTIVSIATFHSGRSWAASMIWSLACLALGGTAGFLFGIPRSRVPGTAAHAAAVATAVTAAGPGTNGSQPAPASPAVPAAAITSAGSETALEQISDWLTKIIVGVGLTNLTRLPGELDRWAYYIAISLDPTGAYQPPNVSFTAGKNFALGLIFYFCVLGLVSGYLLTQMFLLDFINKITPGGGLAPTDGQTVLLNPQPLPPQPMPVDPLTPAPPSSSNGVASSAGDRTNGTGTVASPIILPPPVTVIDMTPPVTITPTTTMVAADSSAPSMASNAPASPAVGASTETAAVIVPSSTETSVPEAAPAASEPVSAVSSSSTEPVTDAAVALEMIPAPSVTPVEPISAPADAVAEVAPLPADPAPAPATQDLDPAATASLPPEELNIS